MHALLLSLLIGTAAVTQAEEPIIAPLAKEQWSLMQKPLLYLVSKADDGDKAPINIMSTIAHHPKLLYAFMPISTALGTASKIDKRDVEILALRTAWRAKSEYEWEHHYSYGLKAGLSEAELASLRTETPAAEFSERDLVLIKTADELVAETQLSAATMNKLKSEYSNAEVIEIIFIVNQYNGLSKFANSLGVELEAGYTDK